MLDIKEICRKYGIVPLRRRGQNFLINKRVLERILEVADLKKDDIILEIGAGFGTLTEELAKRVKKVIAVEIDKKLVEILKENLKDSKNVEIIQNDILALQIEIYKLQDYKVVANLPYNITGAVLRKFLAEEPKPNLMVLMLQKEVAGRICAKPGRMSLLSVMVQFYAQPKIIKVVSQQNFWPRPNVDSAILRITRINADLTQTDADIDEHKFFRLVRQGFTAPRKYLINNLSKNNFVSKFKLQGIFRKIGLNEKVRAQELSVDQWQKILREIYS